MKEKVLIFWVMMLSCMPGLLRGQAAEAEEVTTRNVSYIVIKGDKLKNVAVRFQVPVRTLKKLNKISSPNFTVYPGMVLQVPVKVRPHVWDPSKEDISDAGLLSQDRLPSVDYEIIGEGFDYDIRDDFIAQADAMDDSVQYERIGLHMHRIDKKISQLRYRMDSLKQAEFALQYNDTDINSVLGKMQMARESYYTNGPIGRSIDSLNRLKAQLGNLRIRLRNKKTEYDYLMDNAAYAKNNYERDEKSKDTHWGDQITYESNYARSLARHNEILKEDTAAKGRVDSIKVQPKPIVKDTVVKPDVAVIPPPAVKDNLLITTPVALAKDATPIRTDTVLISTPGQKPVATARDTTPAPKPVAAATPTPGTVVTSNVPKPETKSVAVTQDVPVTTAPVAVPTPRTSPFGLNQKMDISPLIVKRTPAIIHMLYKKPDLVLLPRVPKVAVIDTLKPVAVEPATKDTTPVKAVPEINTAIAKPVAVPAVKDTIPAKVIAKIDTTFSTAVLASTPMVKDTMPAKPVVKLDTVASKTKAIVTSTVKDTTFAKTVGKIDTVVSKKIAVSTSAVKDTKPVSTQTNIDTVSAKAVTHITDTAKSTAVVVKETVLSKPAVSLIKDTVPKTIPALSVKSTTIDTAYHAVIQIKDTLRTKPVAITTSKDTSPKVAAVVKETANKTANPATSKATNTAAPKDTAVKATAITAPKSTANTATVPKASAPAANVADANDAPDEAAIRETKEKAPKAAKDNSKNTHSKSDGSDGDDAEAIKRAKNKTSKTDTTPKLIRIESKDVKGSAATNITENGGPLGSIETKYDSSMLYREKAVNTDPLASYKTDSNFITNAIQLKEIPILEYKNKPKYLIPVDSVSQIKAEFYLIRARQVLEKGDFKEGDKYLRKSLELNPNSAATWMLHADLALTMGAVDKALKEYSISGEIDSSNPKVFYNIALLYSKANDEQKAYKFFSKATDVNDKYLLAYMGRATVLMDQRDYEGAIQNYDKTLSINKYYSPAYKGRALAKMEARRFEDAVTDFNQYLEIEDPDGYVLYERGIAKILSNNLLQGCLDLSSSLELGFKDAEKAIKKFCE